eukprot:4840701-Amphidinium_carterae.2
MTLRELREMARGFREKDSSLGKVVLAAAWLLWLEVPFIFTSQLHLLNCTTTVVPVSVSTCRARTRNTHTHTDTHTHTHTICPESLIMGVPSLAVTVAEASSRFDLAPAIWLVRDEDVQSKKPAT